MTTICIACFPLLMISPHKLISNLNRFCGDRLYKSVYKSRSKICKLKSNFLSRDKVVNTSSKRISDCVVPNGTTYVDCNSQNVILLMTCNGCS